MDFIGNIGGLSELERTFRNLPRSSQNKVFRPALRAGADIIRDAVVENIESITGDESTGFLAKNIRTYQLKKYRGALRAGVRARRGAVYRDKKDKDGPVRAGLVLGVLEYGKKNQAPRSPLRNALRENTAEVFNVVRNEVNARMADAITEAKK